MRRLAAIEQALFTFRPPARRGQRRGGSTSSRGSRFDQLELLELLLQSGRRAVATSAGSRSARARQPRLPIQVPGPIRMNSLPLTPATFRLYKNAFERLDEPEQRLADIGRLRVDDVILQDQDAKSPARIRAAAGGWSDPDRGWISPSIIADERGQEHQAHAIFLHGFERFRAQGWRPVDQLVWRDGLPRVTRAVLSPTLESATSSRRAVRSPALAVPRSAAPRRCCPLMRIEGVTEGRLRLSRKSDRLDRSPVHYDSSQEPSQRRVVVPDRMIPGLEVPLPHAASPIDADQRVTEEVSAPQMPAVLIRRRIPRPADTSADFCFINQSIYVSARL